MVGITGFALSDWLVHGNLGAEIPALVVAVGYRGWPLVRGDYGDGPRQTVRRPVAVAGNRYRRHWNADHPRLHPSTEKAGFCAKVMIPFS